MTMPHQSAQRAPYFQVPLCAFAFGRTPSERLDPIISYGTVEAGIKHWRGLNAAQQEEFKARHRADRTLPSDFDPRRSDHHTALYGAHITNVRINSVVAMLDRHEALSKFQRDFEERHEPDALVRLKSQFVFEARDGDGMSLEELSVLAAIYSVIGDKEHPVRITKNVIRWRSLGYKSKAVMAAAFAKRTDGLRPLTEWKLRALLERLHLRKLFARTTFGRRQTFYSHRLSEAELRAAVVEMKTFAAVGLRARRRDDQEMTAAIRLRRAGLPFHQPTAGHQASTSRLSPTTAPPLARDLTSTLIETSATETSVTETP